MNKEQLLINKIIEQLNGVKSILEENQLSFDYVLANAFIDEAVQALNGRYEEIKTEETNNG
jgi:hypothetical protein